MVQVCDNRKITRSTMSSDRLDFEERGIADFLAD